MKKNFLLTDSAADYENEELVAKDILRVPLTISFGQESFLDGVNLSKDEFYERLLSRQVFPVTSQPSPESFLPHFLKAKEEGNALVAILLSSGLSGTVQSANIAKEMADYQQIYVVDSLSSVTGLRLLVDVANQMRHQGYEAPAIVEEIERLKRRIKIVAMVDTLEYLHCGGRLTKKQAKIGEIMNLKIIFGIDSNGKLEVYDKCLGKTRACKSILKTLEEEPFDEQYPVYIPYSHDKTACDYLVEMARQQWPQIGNDHFYNIGPTIGTHVGDCAFGFSYIRKQ